MLRCFVLDDYQDCAREFADWQVIADRIAVTFIHDAIADEEELARRIADAGILVVMRERTPVTASLIDRLPDLELIITSGMRNAAIDIGAARARGIAVCGTESFSEPPVELAWGLILALARHIVPEVQALRRGGPWQGSVGMDLKGAELGLIGLGKTGAQIARIGKAFGMQVSAWSQNLTPERCEAEGVRFAASKEALLQRADFVSLHVVLGERTRHLIDAAALAAMKPAAFLVNTSRAAVVDGAALADALRSGRIAGAASDVHAAEPLPADSPWRTMPRFLATPHLGYVTRRNYTAYFGQAVEDIEAFLAGTPIRLLG